MVSCLVLNDINIAYSLFGYMLWINNNDKNSINFVKLTYHKKLLKITVLLTLCEVIWLLSVGIIWRQDLP